MLILRKLSYLYNILSGSQEEVERLYRLGYEVENEPEQKLIRTIFNTSEFIKRILEVDNGDLFMSSIAFEDIELFLPTDIDNAINEKLESIGEEKKSIDNTECKNFVLAKKYIDIEELKEDDGNPEVYFDSKYDETRYDIVEEFSSEQASMTPTN